MRIEYRIAKKQDAEVLIKLYNASFYEDYVRYGECPAYGRTKEKMELSIEQYPKDVILCDDVPVGVLSYQYKGEGKYEVGCLCVIPDYQGKGIGTKTIQYMKSICPNWMQITLITPADKEENIKFYVEKCGFQIVEKTMDGNVEVVRFSMNRLNNDKHIIR